MALILRVTSLPREAKMPSCLEPAGGVAPRPLRGCCLPVLAGVLRTRCARSSLSTPTRAHSQSRSCASCMVFPHQSLWLLTTWPSQKKDLASMVRIAIPVQLWRILIVRALRALLG